MADMTYCLTEAAARLLTEMANKHRQQLPPVGRRTRRVDEDGGASFRRVYISEDDESGTAPNDGSGEPVPVYNILAGGPEPFICRANRDLTGDEIEVYWSYPVGVRCTGEAIWIERRKELAGNTVRWEVADAGCSAWYGVQADGNITAGAGYVLLPYVRVAPGTPGIGNDSCRVAVVAGDPSFNVADGALCDVAFDQTTGQFYVTRAYCPS